MKKKTAGQAIVLLALLAGTQACKHDRKSMMMGSWRGTKLENADMDSFFNQSQHYIDTLGKANSPEANQALYGTTNVDSLRKELQMQQDSSKSMQLAAVTNTIFNFQKNDQVIISFNGNMDTSKWHIEADSTLVMEDMSTATKGMTTRMVIKSISDSKLKLEFADENTQSKSYVTFDRVNK